MFNYWIISNQLYFKLHYAYEQTYAQSVILFSRIYEHDEYSADKAIVLVGQPKLFETIQELRDVNITGANKTVLYQTESYPLFLQQYLNVEQRVGYFKDGVVNNAEIDAIIAEMPVFPEKGAITLIDEKIYVKLGEADYNYGS